MPKAVFLDRDGTIIHEPGDLPLEEVGRMRLIPGAAKAIQTLNQMGFLTIMITNQPVVARGLATEKEVDQINAVLVRRLEKRGAKIDAVYSCPHHPDANVPKYRKRCRCRKPNTGMVRRAAKKFKINLKKSFVVGDRTADILLGNRVGAKMILVRTGYGGKDGKFQSKPDFVAKNLKEAARIIKSQISNLKTQNSKRLITNYEWNRITNYKSVKRKAKFRITNYEFRIKN